MAWGSWRWVRQEQIKQVGALGRRTRSSPCLAEKEMRVWSETEDEKAGPYQIQTLLGSEPCDREEIMYVEQEPGLGDMH